MKGARPPKIVAAPELLDRWVGGSERCVRELFREAEEELALCKAAAGSDDSKAFLRSALHVIIIDEIDAVFRKRTDSEDSGSITRNSVVNQILSKIDGVKALPNVLTIAMTNRRELIGKNCFCCHSDSTYQIVTPTRFFRKMRHYFVPVGLKYR